MPNLREEGEKQPLAMQAAGSVPMYHYQELRATDARLWDANISLVKSEILSTRESLVALDSRITGAITERDKALIVALTAVKETTQAALVALESRLELLNEFRAQAENWAKTFALKDPTESMVQALGARLDQLAVSQTEALRTRASVVDKDLDALTSRILKIENEQLGSRLIAVENKANTLSNDYTAMRGAQAATTRMVTVVMGIAALLVTIGVAMFFR